MNKKNYLKSVMAVVLLALICMTGRSVQAAETSEPHLSFKVSSDTFAESISGKWKTDKKGKRYLSVRSENQWKDLLFFSKDWADGYRMDEDWQI